MLAKPSNNSLRWLAAFFLLAPFWQGLYFPHQVLAGLGYLGALVLINLVRNRQSASCTFRSPLCWGAFLISAGYAVATAQAPGQQASWLEFARTIYGPLVLISVCHLQTSERLALWRAVFWSGIGVATLGLLALAGWIQWPGMVLAGRLQSTFQYANATADLLLVALVVGMSTFPHGQVKSRQVIHGGLCLILMIAFGATGSRTSLLLYIPTLTLLWAATPSPGRARLLSTMGWLHLVLALILSFASIEQGLPDWREFSWQAGELQTRLGYYREAVKVIVQHPLLGMGGGWWGATHQVQWVHSHPLQLAVDAGLLVAVVWVFTFLIFWLNSWRNLNSRHGGSPEIPVARAVVALLFSHSLLDLNLTFPALSSLYWLAIVGQGDQPAPVPELPGKTP